MAENLEGAGAEAGAVVGSLRRDDGGLDRFLANAAELWVRGAEVDLAAVPSAWNRISTPSSTMLPPTISVPCNCASGLEPPESRAENGLLPLN